MRPEFLSLTGTLIVIAALTTSNLARSKGKAPPPLSWTWGMFFATGPAAFIQLVGLACWLIGDLLDGNYIVAVPDLLLIGGCIYHWWKTRNKNGGDKKKALKALGEKSLAKLQELADKITPAPAPLPSRI
jgi:hypothetical protein